MMINTALGRDNREPIIEYKSFISQNEILKNMSDIGSFKPKYIEINSETYNRLKIHSENQKTRFSDDIFQGILGQIDGIKIHINEQIPLMYYRIIEINE